MSGLAGFLAKYAVEVGSIASLLDGIVNALPIDGQDKAKAKTAILALQAASASVAEAAKVEAKAAKVVIKKSDIEAAVKSQLQAIVKAEVEKALQNANSNAASKKAEAK